MSCRYGVSSRGIKQSLTAGLLLALVTVGAAAAPLGEVVRHALESYPAIEVARANTDSARFQVDQAKAGHFPTVDLTSQRRIAGAASSLSQPRLRLNLYASGAIEAGVDRERWREQSLLSNERVTREEVAFGAGQAWFRMVRALRQAEAAQRNLNRHQNLVDDFAAIVAIDQGRRFDLVQARSRTEQVRQTLAGFESEVASAREALARFYRAPIQPELMHLPADMPDELPENNEQSAADAVTRHPAVEASRRSLLSAEAAVRASRAARGPRLDLEATGGRDNASIVFFTWPAFDLSRSAAEGAAAASLTGARAAVEEQERLVQERQRSALQDFLSARRRESVARGQIDLGGELVDIYRAQFQIGRRNLLDLLTAFNELYLAEAAFEAARVDKLLSRYRMEYAVGRFAALFEGRKP